MSVHTSEERGGGEFANVDMLKALASRGARCTLLTNQVGLSTGAAGVAERAIDLGPKLSTRTRLTSLRRFPPGLARLRSALQALAPVDVLVVHFKKEQFMASLLPRSLAPRVMWAEWGPLPEPMRTGPARVLYVNASRRADTILAVSESTRASLIDVGVSAGKLTVVPPFTDVNTAVFDPGARRRLRTEWGVSDDTFVVGCVSRLNHVKRNDVVIDALAHLPENVVLVLAGDGPDEAALRARAAPYGARVRFLPNPRGHVGQVLSACDIQAFAPQPLEGLPRAIVFGQLTERPVIATAPQGTELIVAGTGTVLTGDRAHDPRALAVELERYREDPALRAREGTAGRRHVLGQVDPTRITDRLEAIVSATVRGRGGVSLDSLGTARRPTAAGALSMVEA